ncbi:MAG: aspartyl/glutamyl-tRNA amidotransferase subunit B [Gemmatimonadetes bacterium SCN 70-22]|nr:MAG: aspartyl/glutamyl-tRNA amidotransferase subunit B [Gemmatimonadetes bacterium SCN 70-22]
MAASWHPRYELVVGLEVHVQLKTRSKIFCPCSTEFGAPPNANTCPVCLALPGALPVLNAHAVQLAVRAALALDCTVHRASVFARKNYFYPDLPKGYQISQFDQPLATGGRLVIGTADDGAPRVVGITRAHMEEDAGKSVHDRFPSATAIDLNRAGTPLVEIVSEPDIRTPAEAREYCVRLKEVLEYTEVSDANMEEGSLRVDANVSIRPHGSATLGTKTEIKNMNSFAGVERAIAVEFERQCALLEAGERVVQQTLLWDADRHEVRPARSKEGSHDYRYFPDPDLPPLLLAEHWIEAQRRALPELPAARRTRLQAAYALSPYDAGVLTATRALADFYEAVAQAHGDGKAAANWVMGEVLAYLNNAGIPIAALRVAPAELAALLGLVREGAVSNSAAKKVFAIMVRDGGAPRALAEREGLMQVSDDAALAAWVDEVWAAHPDEVRRLAAGEKKLLGVLVGAVMKRSGGRADPRKVNQLLAARLSATTP